MAPRLRLYSVAAAVFMSAAVFGCGSSTTAPNPTPTRLVVLTNLDTAKEWVAVLRAIKGGPDSALLRKGTTYDLDLSGVPDNGYVSIIIATKARCDTDTTGGFAPPSVGLAAMSTVRGSPHVVAPVRPAGGGGTTCGYNIYVWSETAWWYLHTPAASTYLADLGGPQTGTVTGAPTLTAGQKMSVVAAYRQGFIDMPGKTFSIWGVPTGSSVLLASALGPNDERPLTFSSLIASQADGDITSMLSPQNPAQNWPFGTSNSYSQRVYAYTTIYDPIYHPGCDGPPLYKALIVGGQQWQIPAIGPSYLPANVLQGLDVKVPVGYSSWVESVLAYHNLPSSAMITVGPPGTAPTITPLPTSPFPAFNVQFPIQIQYNLAARIRFDFRTSSGRWSIDMFTGNGQNTLPSTLSLTTPTSSLLTPYLPPAGTPGTWSSTVYGNDPYTPPTDGGVRLLARTFGTTGPPPPTASVSGSAPTVTVAPGGTSPIPITIVRTNFKGLVFLGVGELPAGFSADPSSPVVLGNTFILNINAPTNATPGSTFTIPVTMGHPWGYEVFGQFNVTVTVQ